MKISQILNLCLTSLSFTSFLIHANDHSRQEEKSRKTVFLPPENVALLIYSKIETTVALELNLTNRHWRNCYPPVHMRKSILERPDFFVVCLTACCYLKLLNKLALICTIDALKEQNLKEKLDFQKDSPQQEIQLLTNVLEIDPDNHKTLDGKVFHAVATDLEKTFENDHKLKRTIPNITQGLSNYISASIRKNSKVTFREVITHAENLTFDLLKNGLGEKKIDYYLREIYRKVKDNDHVATATRESRFLDDKKEEIKAHFLKTTEEQRGKILERIYWICCKIPADLSTPTHPCEHSKESLL